ncbi:MAG: choice-of-anchor tandem repeat NxxGxxAF-containing protein [Pirellulales bacterium]
MTTAAASGFRLVAKTGDLAPIAGGNATLLGLTAAEINARGDVLYASSVQDPTIAFRNNLILGVARSDGTAGIVARTAWTLPGAPDGSRFIGFGRMMINESGNVAFEGTMHPPTTDPVSYDTLWENSGGLHLVDYGRRDGSESYDGTELRVDDMDHSGRVLYTKYRSSSSGSVLTFGHETWWVAAPGSPNREIVTEGSSQIIPPGSAFTYAFIFDTPRLSNNGRVVFAAQLTGSGIDTTNNDTIWIDDNGDRQIVYRDGQAASGMPSGIVFTQVRDSISNTSGKIAFKATIGGPGVDATNSKALFSNAGGTLHLAARTGQVVPGVGTLQDRFYLDDIAGASTGFSTTFSTDENGGWGEATFAERNGVVRVIARNGQAVPGMAGFLFTSFGDLQAVPGSDRFVVASYAQRASTDYIGGVWVENEDFSLLPLLVGGMQVPLGGESKTAQSVSMGKFNSRGELPLTVTFTDNSSAVFVWDGKLSSLVVEGDYNSDGRVNAADYSVWRNTLGSRSDLRANGNNSGASAGVIDQADYALWKSHYGEFAFRNSAVGGGAPVPEPSGGWLLFLLLATPIRAKRPRF